MVRAEGHGGYTPFSKCVTHYDTFSHSAAKMSWALRGGVRLLREPAVVAEYRLTCNNGVFHAFSVEHRRRQYPRIVPGNCREWRPIPDKTRGAKTGVCDDSDDDDDIFHTAPTPIFIVTIVIHRHSDCFLRKILLPALVRLDVYWT